jgi:integrase
VGTTPLRDEAGNHLKDPDTPDSALKLAYAHHQVAMAKQAKVESHQQATGDDTTLAAVCDAYLGHVQKTLSDKTYQTRAKHLYDLTTGYPARFWLKNERPKPADRIHRPYGLVRVGDLTPADIQQWLDAHPTWGDSATKTAVTGVHAALNHAVKMGRIPNNPIRGYHPGKWATHITFFDETVEAALYEHANPVLETVLRVLIATGARPGELCKVAPRHVQDTEHGMEWHFAPEEHKTGHATGTPRIVLVPDSVAPLVREAMAHTDDKHTPIFSNTKRTPWTPETSSRAFRLLRGRLQAQGYDLSDDDTVYSCRHTFARRALWGAPGRPPVPSLQILAQLMGNSAKIYHEHYAKWCSKHMGALWQALNGA